MLAPKVSRGNTSSIYNILYYGYHPSSQCLGAGGECGAQPFSRLKQTELGSSFLHSEIPGGMQEVATGNLSAVWPNQFSPEHTREARPGHRPWVPLV